MPAQDLSLSARWTGIITEVNAVLETSAPQELIASAKSCGYMV